MKVLKPRSFVLLLAIGIVASISLAPAAPAAPGSGFHLAFVSGRGPADALKDQTITNAAFQPGGSAVQVELLTSSNNRVTNLPVTVTLDLRLNGGAAVGLTVTAVTTSQGVATFTDPKVSVPNIAEISDYTLVARSTSNPEVGPGTSSGFDIWGNGQTCAGGVCTLTHPTAGDVVPDTYRDSTSNAGAVITASTFTEPALSGLVDCVGYTELTNFSIWHEYTAGDTLFVVTHTSRDEMKNAASNGQVSVQLCLALSEPWTAKPVTGFTTPQPVDTNGDTVADLYIGLAPKCPKKNAADAAPCVVAQYGDGNGGNYTEAWLPGTDPGKRS